MQVWNMRHVARWKCTTQKIRQKSPSGHHRTYLCNQGTHRQSGNNLLSSNMSSICPHNMVNFGPLATEIDPVVWGTPANFNRFRVWQCYCTASSSGRQPNNFAALNRGRHLCLAGRPSRWALAHILVIYGVHIVATWRIRLSHPCAVGMQPYVKLLWPLVI